MLPVLLAVAVCVGTATAAALDHASTTVRYRARMAYHGGSFAGFQLQTTPKGLRTVQGVLEVALQQSFGMQGERCVKVVGAGRTDAGVHARGQAIHFDAPATSSLDDVQRSLERLLPDDAAVWDLQVAPVVLKGDFEHSFLWSAIYQATHKLYIYRISLGPVMDPLDRHWRWHVPYHRDVDIVALNRTLKLFVGTHDFRAFASSNFEGSTSIRTVYSVDLIQENDDGDYRMEFVLQGALYKQVRNMVGSSLEEARRPGKRRRNVNIALLLSNGASREDNPAVPAPPQGLTLEHVYYDDF